MTTANTTASNPKVVANPVQYISRVIGGTTLASCPDRARYGMIVSPNRVPMKIPIATATPMTMSCSSRISIRSWRIDRPIVRKSPNSVRRRRNATRVCTTKPIALTIKTVTNATPSNALQPSDTRGSTLTPARRDKRSLTGPDLSRRSSKFRSTDDVAEYRNRAPSASSFMISNCSMEGVPASVLIHASFGTRSPV